MAKIAAEVLEQGEGWRVADVICGSGPDDHPFEERHSAVSIAVVIAGTFQYRTGRHAELMAPGALLLGNPGQSFECGHEHGTGDRCVSFRYAPELFERITGSRARFRVQRLPPSRALAPLVARTCAALAHPLGVSWEELATDLAATAIAHEAGCDAQRVPPNAAARVTRAIRRIERHPDAPLSLQHLASDAALSPYHFLRTFTRLAGATPHQFAMRVRLRNAAVQLTTSGARVIDVALDSGFGDVSNFNRAFRAEFGVSPRAYRRAR